MKRVPYTESHQRKGEDYQRIFAERPHLRLLWALERRWLSAFVAARFDRPPAHLDFACGTGRILAHLAPRCARSVGLDVSASMLEVARRAAPAATLIEADATRDDPLGDARFDLITAFRFFPNAEPALRAAALAVLARHLAPGGVIVFNNHLHRRSLRARIASARGRLSPLGMTDDEARALVAGAGLVVDGAHGLGLLPLSDTHMLLPGALAEPLERALSRAPGAWRLAQDVIYVCGRP